MLNFACGHSSCIPLLFDVAVKLTLEYSTPGLSGVRLTCLQMVVPRPPFPSTHGLVQGQSFFLSLFKLIHYTAHVHMFCVQVVYHRVRLSSIVCYLVHIFYLVPVLVFLNSTLYSLSDVHNLIKQKMGGAEY